jgi:hypothetical protein
VPADAVPPISNRAFSGRVLSRGAPVSSLLLISWGCGSAGLDASDSDETNNGLGVVRRTAGADLGVSAERGSALSSGSPAEVTRGK